jgi:hypothetical protein
MGVGPFLGCDRLKRGIWGRQEEMWWGAGDWGIGGFVGRIGHI